MSEGEVKFEYLEPLLCDLVVDTFKGDVDEAQNYDGTGSMKMRNGCSYDGAVKTGLFHGKGVFKWPNGVQYEGSFYEGRIEGKGTFSWPDGSKYTGEVKNGKRCGYGVFHCSAGQVYEGNWLDGMRHGKGTASYQEKKDSTVYTGEWVEDLRQGYGIMKYASGNTYEGHWHHDKKNGMGLMVWKDRDNVYAGEWLDDLPHGEGENLWANMSLSKLMTKQMSSIYRGKWDSGMKHGDGAFFYADGSSYWGTWHNNVKDGDGVLQHGDGRIAAAKFVNGQNVLEATPPPSANPSKSRKGRSTSATPHSSPSSRADGERHQEVKMHVRDLLLALPKADAALNPGTDHVSRARVFTNSRTAHDWKAEAREIERLMLRFNTSLKQVHGRLVESSDKDRRRNSVMSDLAKLNFDEMDTVVATALSNHQRFSCLSLRDMKTFCREIGLLGSHFTSHQVTDALRRAIEEQKNCASYAYIKQQLQKRKPTLSTPPSQPSSRARTPQEQAVPEAEEVADVNEPVISTPESEEAQEMRSSSELMEELEIKPPSLPNVWGTSVGPSAIGRSSFDAEQPICEQNFYNVLVRCVLQSDLYQSSHSPVYIPGTAPTDEPRVPLGVFQALLMTLRRIHARQEEKIETEPLLAALVSDSIQGLLLGNAEHLQSLWRKCTDFAAADGISVAADGQVQFRHIVRALLGLKGNCIRDSCSTSDLIRVMQRAANSFAEDVTPMRPETAPAPADAPPRNQEVSDEVAVEAEPEAETAPVADAAESEEEAAVANAASQDASEPKAVEPPAPPKAIDVSSLMLLCDYDDFTEILCKVVLSDSWVYTPPKRTPESEPSQEQAENAEAEGEVETKTAEPEKEKADDQKQSEAEAEAEAEGEHVPEVELEAYLPVGVALHRRLSVFFDNFTTIL